ncbi:MAG: hypothetical protein JWP47_174 [Polaromonas sp.]|nr:hypothetical protein [Polaromonas sp.]
MKRAIAISLVTALLSGGCASPTRSDAPVSQEVGSVPAEQSPSRPSNVGIGFGIGNWGGRGFGGIGLGLGF